MPFGVMGWLDRGPYASMGRGIFGRDRGALHCGISPVKLTQPIEMPFGVLNQVCPRNHVLDRSPDITLGRGLFCPLTSTAFPNAFSLGPLYWSAQQKWENIYVRTTYNTHLIALCLGLPM